MVSSADELKNAVKGNADKTADRRDGLPGAPVPRQCCVNGEAGKEGPRRIGSEHFCCEMVIVNELGLHVRPASLFVALSNKFDCAVTIHKGGEQVDGKSIIQLLSLSAESGTPLVLETRGSDAQAAADALSRLVASGFAQTKASGFEAER